MKKNIELIIDGIAPEKVMYDTDNHSLVVLYPAQREFKRGDIVVSKDTGIVAILGDLQRIRLDRHSLIYAVSKNGIKCEISNISYLSCNRVDIATPEEQQILFDALKKEGKKWNAETLEVEVVPEFKRGDVITCRHNDEFVVFIITSPVLENRAYNTYVGINMDKQVLFDTTFGNKEEARLATHEEHQVLFDALKSIGKKWCKETLQIKDLDITEIVVNRLSACEYLNKPMPKNYVYEPNSDFEKQINAQITLQLICEAWNKFDGFVVDWNDIEQEKYAPYRYAGSGDLYAVNSSNWLGFESLIVFKSTERAIQFGNQFKELFKTAMGL